MSMNSGGNSLFSVCFMAECKSHISSGLFFLSVAILAVYTAFSVWKKKSRNRLDVALQNLDNDCTTNEEVTCKRQ